MVIFGLVHANNRYLLVIRGSGPDTGNEIELAMLSAYSGKAALRVKNTSRESQEYIYELSQALLNKPLPQGKKITDVLYEIEGVTQVNLVMQSEEVSR